MAYQNRRELIDAAFALNEGGWGELDTSGTESPSTSRRVRNFRRTTGSR
jgi:hypothetical protein